MENTNENIVKKFFDAYGKHDRKGIRDVMSEDVTWTFNGRHPLAGTKNGVEEVILFFDTMAGIILKSKPEIEKLIVASNDNHFIECQRISTHREDGNNIHHHVTVLWTIKNGKIISGRHFFADPQAVDNYFSRIVQQENIPQ